MEELASKMDQIGGYTEYNYDLSEPSGINRRRLTNSFVDSIARQCVTTGLAYDEKEAYAVIVPAFYKHDVLPKQTHNFKKWPRDVAGRQENSPEYLYPAATRNAWEG